MSQDNININIQETNDIVNIVSSEVTEVIDINVGETVEEVTLNITEEIIQVNINKVTGGAVSSVNGLTGDVVLDIPTATSDLTNDSNFVSDASYVHTDNNYTTTEKNKLAGIAAGAEVNVNADWNATSGDSQILNKPTIPDVSGFATTTYVDTQDALKVDKVAGSRLITSAEATILGNTSGTNTGDNAVNSLYSGLASSKQDTLVSGTNIKTINGTTILGNGNINASGIIISEYIDTGLTGTTTNTIVKSYLIPANTFTANDMFKLLCSLSKGVTTGSATLRTYLNTSISLTGASLLSTYTYGTTTRYAVTERVHICSSSSNLLCFSPGSNSTTDRTNITVGLTAVPYTYTSDIYLLIAIQLSNAADTANLALVNLTK